jgi:hypothetical protein
MLIMIRVLIIILPKSTKFLQCFINKYIFGFLSSLHDAAFYFHLKVVSSVRIT